MAFEGQKEIADFRLSNSCRVLLHCCFQFNYVSLLFQRQYLVSSLFSKNQYLLRKTY